MKVFADNVSNMAQMIDFFLDSAENIMGKGENDDSPHFLLFSQFLQKAFS